MLEAYSVDDITIIRVPDPAYTEWNEPIAPTEEAVTGYVEWETKLVRDFAGEEVVSRGHVILTYDGAINHKDKIKINGDEYVIVALEPMKDFSNVGLKVFIV